MGAFLQLMCVQFTCMAAHFVSENPPIRVSRLFIPVMKGDCPFLRTVPGGKASRCSPETCLPARGRSLPYEHDPAAAGVLRPMLALGRHPVKVDAGSQ